MGPQSRYNTEKKLEKAHSRPTEKIALIDADSLIYFEMGKPTLEEALNGIDSRIEQMLIETEATHYAGFLTSGKCFRYAAANKTL